MVTDPPASTENALAVTMYLAGGPAVKFTVAVLVRALPFSVPLIVADPLEVGAVRVAV
jgi:hypothetical protein